MTSNRNAKDLSFRKFDIRKIGNRYPGNPSNKPDKIVMLIGKRNTGKSWAVRDIMYNNRNIPTGMIMSGTEHATGFYSEHFPKLFTFDTFESDQIQKMLIRQKKLSNSYGGADKCHQKWCTMLVLDDLMGSDRRWVKNKYIQEIFMNGRHYNILLLATTQYPLGIPPDLRTNVDYVFIFRENNRNIRKKLFDYYAGIFDSFKMFCAVMDKLTENYGCMVLDNRTTSNNLYDVVFWYKANDVSGFRFGSDKFWRYHHKYFKKEELNLSSKEKYLKGSNLYNVRKSKKMK